MRTRRRDVIGNRNVDIGDADGQCRLRCRHGCGNIDVRVDLGAGYEFRGLPMRPALAVDLVNLFDARYAYRINNGFNGSHWAPGRSIFARVSATF